MRNKSLINRALISILGVLLLASAIDARAAQRNKAPGQLESSTARDVRRMEALKEEVRHQLAMLPYYSVFDWLQAEVKPDGSVTLMGEVVRPTLKDDAEARVKKLEAATRVVNNIEVLALSPMDDQLRLRLYRAIYGYAPLQKYALGVLKPIRIIVPFGPGGGGHIVGRIFGQYLQEKLGKLGAKKKAAAPPALPISVLPTHRLRGGL